jgi:subtilisin family serine protease
VNGSYGGPIWSKAERAALKTAGQTSLFVFAAGNNALDNDVWACRGTSIAGCSPSYPASYTLNSILSVAASNDTDHYGYHSGCGTPQACVFSNWGRTSVDVAAPGVDIISTRPGDAYFTIDGTSMAAPHVSGAAGLVESANPTHTPVDLKNAIMNSVANPAALDLYVGGLGFTTPIEGDFTVTQGRIDVNAALSAPISNATPTTDDVPSGANGIRKSKQGSLAFPADQNDFYRKRLYKGVKYKVTLTVPGGANFDVVLWRSGVTETWSLTAQCYGFAGEPCPIANAGFKTGLGADEAFTFKPGKGGTFYVHVSSAFDDGNYTVKIVKV